MKRAAILLALGFALAPADASKQSYETAVVGLSITAQAWDQDRPWTKQNPVTRSAQAVVVEGPYLLTTADVLADATLVEATSSGGTARSPARTLLVDEEINLALLSVETASFFSGLAPVRLAPEIPLEGSVLSVRWRERQIEVSTSRISRLEVESTLFGSIDHPFLYVTTDFSGGGWAEPVFDGAVLIGLTASQSGQVARVIPVDVLTAFLERARAAEGYLGFPGLELQWQVNEDPVVMQWLGAEADLEGIVVTGVPRGSSALGALEPRDVLLSLDGKAIDGAGYYRHRRYGRLRFTAIPADGHAPGEVLQAEVWRDGARRVLDLPLARADAETDLIPARRSGRPPAYAVFGGFVFRELDGPYLKTWGEDWTADAPLALVTRYSLFRKDQEPDHRRVIVISAVLPAAYNVGYHDVGDLEVRAINGRTIDSVEDVVEAFAHPEGAFHRIELAPNGLRDEIVLDAPSLDEATRQILSDYGVPEAVRLPEPSSAVVNVGEADPRASSGTAD